VYRRRLVHAGVLLLRLAGSDRKRSRTSAQRQCEITGHR
jgi:hypothetical protein